MKSVLITGGSSGIGEAVAYKLSSTGVEQLFICGTNVERLQAVQEKCLSLGAKAVSVKQLDVTNRIAVAEWIIACNAEKPLDLVYANAGVATGEEYVNSNVFRTFDINVGGVINTVLPAIECFLAREKADPATGFKGQIAITASMAGYHGLPQCPSYSATKACVKAWGSGLRGMLAKNDIESDDIYIFDTYSLCIGGGLLVLEAAKMVEEGLDIDTIIKKLEEYKEKVEVYFSVDSLDYLYKGGRISGAKAAVGTLLNIKPILKIEDGLVKQKTQVRGSKKIIPTLIEKLKEEVGDDFSDKDVYVGYGDDLENHDKFVERVKEELCPKNVYTFRIGSCVACHSGPTVIGLACLNK
jgi:NADP-dependent 3-hydroxy acid dehydrogenase YdfG